MHSHRSATDDNDCNTEIQTRSVTAFVLFTPIGDTMILTVYCGMNDQLVILTKYLFTKYLLKLHNHSNVGKS